MAGGEKAKSSGEYGEKIVKNLLEIFGWKDCISGVTVPCVHQDTHKKQNADKSEKHGIDYVFKYKSPLRDTTRCFNKRKMSQWLSQNRRWNKK